MQQNGKRASLRCDKLFTDEGVYTYDTSNNSVVRLSPSRSWAPLCAAPKMDEVMSDDDTQRLQGGRKKERMGERPPLGTSSASDLVMPDGSDAAGSSNDASDNSATLSARGTREAHPSSSNIVHPASSATPYSHGCQEEFISGRISDRTPKDTLRGAHLSRPSAHHPRITVTSPSPSHPGEASRGAYSKPPTTDEPQPPSFLPLPSQSWPCSQNRPPRFNSRSSPTLTGQGPRDGVGPQGDHADSSLSSASPSSTNKS